MVHSAPTAAPAASVMSMSPAHGEGDNGRGDDEPAKNAADLRVLALIPSIPLGGMERAALNVCQRLAAAGADVHALAERRWGTKVQAELTRLGLAYSTISAPPALMRPTSLIEARVMAWGLIATRPELSAAARRHRPNVLLATATNVAFAARHLARQADVVSLYRIPNPPAVRTDTGLKARADRAIWRAIGASYDHLVCNAHYTGRLVGEVTGRPDKVRVVRNYPPTTTRRIETPAPRLDPARRHVIYLGQIAHHKGMDVLLEATRLLVADRPDVDVVLAGSAIWRDPYETALSERIAAAGLTERYRLIGPIDDVQGLLTQGAVHVCPSISPGDSFPNVILDAKQAGLPSVVLPTAGLPEAIEDGVDGLVMPDHSPAPLAAALGQLLDNPAKAAAMGAAARTSLAARFDPAALTATWTALCSSADAPPGTALNPSAVGG